MQLHFAYLGTDEDFDPATHAIYEEEVFGITVKHVEDGFAKAQLRIKAKPAGVVAQGQRCAISVAHDGAVHPIIVGQIRGVPLAIAGSYIDIEVVGKKTTWADQESALVRTIGWPFFDRLMVPADQIHDPAARLTGRGATIAWHRVSNAPTLNVVLGSGKTTHDLGAPYRDTVEVDQLHEPVSSMSLTLRAAWTQGEPIEVPVAWSFGEDLTILADKALREAWPQKDDDIGGGWKVSASAIGFSGQRHRFIQIANSSSFAREIYYGEVPFYEIEPAVSLRNTETQPRAEALTLTVGAGLQSALPAKPESDEIVLRGLIGSGDEIDAFTPGQDYSAGDVVFYEGKILWALEDHTAPDPIDLSKWEEDDPSQGRLGDTFFGTSRGARTIEAGIERIKARLRYAARCWRVEAEVPLERVLGMHMGDRATIADPRIPGGTATGDVIEYEFRISNNGQSRARVAIAAAIGDGVAHALSPVSLGDPTAFAAGTYAATGSVSPSASEQLASLEANPSAYDIEITVRIDADPLALRDEIRWSETHDLGTLAIEQGVSL